MEEGSRGKRWVGIDCGKRTYEAKVIDHNGRVTGFNGKTDAQGIDRMIKHLRVDDVVGIEAGVPAFNIARILIEKVGLEVHVLNPGKLAVIYMSLKKTDKEDALKLARLVMRFPKEELPIVSLPTEEEERNRALVSEQLFLKKERTRLINRLHSIYLRTGITDVVKKNLKDGKSRSCVIERLSGYQEKEARRIGVLLDETEGMLKEIEAQINERLKENEDTQRVMSIPGVGPVMAMAFLSYVGDGSRFSSAQQVSYYTGLVPRVDCSGDTVIYGSISKRGCTAIRRVAVQAAWALIRTRGYNPLKQKYEELRERKGRNKAIVAIARKMVEMMYVLVKTKSSYDWMDEESRIYKMKGYKLYAPDFKRSVPRIGSSIAAL